MSGPRTASDIMVRNVISVGPDDHVYDGMRTLLHHRITGAPVIDQDNLYLGVFSEKPCLSLLALTAQAADRASIADNGTAESCMTRKLITLSEDTDAVRAMEILLDNRISGAPVVAGERFLGVFSERFAMNVLMAFVYDQIPAASVRPFANRDMERVVSPEMPILEIAQRFLDTDYRRLPVLDGERLVGQISRRDVLRGRHHLAAVLAQPEAVGIAGDSSAASRQAHSLLAGGPFAGGLVRTAMDGDARTISPGTSLLDIAHIFMTTDLRRLPVVENRKLQGQLSRRDVLAAFVDQLKTTPSPERALLYLSAVTDQEQGRAQFR